MQVTLQRGDFGTYLAVAEDGRSELFQTDWDYLALANNFGWEGYPIVDGSPASETIAEAIEYLDENIGAKAEDPGYFEGPEYFEAP